MGVSKKKKLFLACLCQAVGMAEKRTKLEKSQRQADQLEKRADTRPEQTPEKGTLRENTNQPAPDRKTNQ